MTRIKILLVDDEKIFREEFEHIFLDSKYLLDTAVNSIEGRNKILNSHFDLIILDIRMPDFDNRFSEKGGIELLKWIRKNKQELLVIMLSVLCK
jgi:CheY-like chemotaxis protein